MELLVYTQDMTYSNSLDESKKEEQEEKNGHKKGLQLFDHLGPTYIRNNQATMEELMLHLKSYYRVCVDHSITQNICGFCGGRHQNFPSSALDCKSTPG